VEASHGRGSGAGDNGSRRWWCCVVVATVRHQLRYTVGDVGWCAIAGRGGHNILDLFFFIINTTYIYKSKYYMVEMSGG
jgi:hypothetical protein